jgi:hypothetical protein
MSERKFTVEDCFSLTLLLAMLAWFAEGMALGGKVPFYRDLGTYFYPMRWSLAQSFKAGELPLWDSHAAMGFPLLADFQSGAFYPPHLLYLVLPFFAAVRATFLFHYVAAITGSYALCRRWNYPPYLSVIGAIVFTFGGAIISLNNVLNHFQAAVWLPWAALLWEKLLAERSWKAFFLFALVLEAQFLAGSPEFYAMSACLLFLDGIRMRSEEAARGWVRMGGLFLAATSLVAALGAVQLLPTTELLHESRRPQALPYAEASGWSLHPLGILNLFLLNKEVDPGLGNGLRLFFDRDIPFFISHYLGAVTLLGGALWLYYASRKERVILSLLILASLALAFGRYTPVYPFLFRHISLLALVRFPEKFYFLAYALILFVSLRGLYNFLESGRPLSRGSCLVLFSIPAFLGLLYLFLRLHPDHLLAFIAWSKQLPAPSAVDAKMMSGVLFQLERLLVLLIAALLVQFLWLAGKLRKSLFRSLAVGIVFVDLGLAHRPYQFLLDPGVAGTKPPVAREPQPYRLFYLPRLGQLHPAYYTFSERPFASAAASVFANLIPNSGVFYGLDYMQEIDALGRKPYDLFLEIGKSLPPERLCNLLGALNVKYLITLQPLPPGGARLVRHFPEHPSWLYQITRLIPRAYIVSEVAVEGDDRKTLERLSSPKFDPLREVILEKPLSSSLKGGSGGDARIVRYENQSVLIHARLASPGVLILADSFYPGWRAYVDGKEKKILRANFFFRAVALEAGDHWVEFRYRPRSFAVGLAVSLATLCLLALWTFRQALLPRRRRG